ncbi:MAG: hypothetical protein JRF35_10720 [Deltaproteobacteria bacterium]|nr:hypothetical protein [Deltaproteobacteria bacterium]
MRDPRTGALDQHNTVTHPGRGWVSRALNMNAVPVSRKNRAAVGQRAFFGWAYTANNVQARFD